LVTWVNYSRYVKPSKLASNYVTEKTTDSLWTCSFFYFSRYM